MKRSQKLLKYLTVGLLLNLTVGFLLAQTPKNFSEHNRLIRIKKIANEWQGSILTLHMRDGDAIEGRLVEVSGGEYHLQVGPREIRVPLGDVVSVSFDPGMSEVMLSFASAAMGASFLAGALMVASGDASSSALSTAALLGMLGGGLWGYTTFYEIEVIELE